MGVVVHDDLVVITETEDALIKRLNDWKDFMENRDMRVNMNKTKVMISGEWQKVMQKVVRWPGGVHACGRGTYNRFTAGLEYVRVHPGQQVPER